MKTAFKALSISFLLLSGMLSAHANPNQRQQWRDELREMQMQKVWAQPDGARGAGPQQRMERRRVSDGSSESGGVGGNNPSAEGRDDARKPGKMTPEERRALRRQINEAGRDIYAPNR